MFIDMPQVCTPEKIFGVQTYKSMTGWGLIRKIWRLMFWKFHANLITIVKIENQFSVC